jgi:phospholipid-binding lipoprotein MlaA
MNKTVRASLLVLGCLLLFGCASLPPNAKRDPRDPWERMNRTTFKVNTAVDHAVTRPIARTYEKITPRIVRTGVSNFMDNLFYPVTMANDLLQAKFKPFAQDTGRFVLNTLAGLGGILDPATQAGLPKNEEDLGQTFGRWGAGPGPYFVIPLLGPSDIRDGLGRVGDIWLSPPHYINNNYVSYGLWGVGVLDARYRLLPQDKLLDEAYDPYTLLKNAYLQRRQFLVTDGKVSEEDRRKQEQEQYDEEKKILEESGPDDSEAPSPPAAPSTPAQPSEPPAPSQPAQPGAAPPPAPSGGSGPSAPQPPKLD